MSYRVYAKYLNDGPGYALPGVSLPEPTSDAWQQGRFGFRMDWKAGRDNANLITVQGDHYVGQTDNSIIPFSGVNLGSFNDRALPDQLTGDNLLVRWRHTYDENTDWTLQTYYDNYMRSDALQTEIDRTFDVDFQYRFSLGERHKITCGGGFRNVESYFPGGDQLTNYFPFPSWTTNKTNEFVQDEIAIIEDRVTFTIGTSWSRTPTRVSNTNLVPASCGRPILNIPRGGRFRARFAPRRGSKRTRRNFAAPDPDGHAADRSPRLRRPGFGLGGGDCL